MVRGLPFMKRERPVITMLTDFGLADEYVGVMKGVIATISSDAQIIDISHDIARHDVRQAAFVLKNAFRYFPKGSIHIIVVDPGVGGHRKILCLKNEDHYFIAPDNGVLSLVVHNKKVEALRAVTSDRYFLKPVSNTFHGRDIFAPVAGHLAEGVAMSTFGKELAREDIYLLDVAVPTLSDDELIGEVISIDRFGNLVTNIDQQTYLEYTREREPENVVIRLGGLAIRGVSTSYDGAEMGAPVAVFGSRDLLEISVNQADASTYFGASVGQTFKLQASAKKGDPQRCKNTVATCKIR
jgi:S-adenosylmethionine hydrolase